GTLIISLRTSSSTTALSSASQLGNLGSWLTAPRTSATALASGSSQMSTISDSRPTVVVQAPRSRHPSCSKAGFISASTPLKRGIMPGRILSVACRWVLIAVLLRCRRSLVHSCGAGFLRSSVHLETVVADPYAGRDLEDDSSRRVEEPGELGNARRSQVPDEPLGEGGIEPFLRHGVVEHPRRSLVRHGAPGPDVGTARGDDHGDA